MSKHRNILCSAALLAAMAFPVEGGSGSEGTNLEETFDELSLADQPKLLMQVPHDHKPNWMTSSFGTEPHRPSSIFVADTTSDITVYYLPQKG